MKSKTICAITIAAGLLGAAAGWQAKSTYDSREATAEMMSTPEIMKGYQFGDTMKLVHLDNLIEKDSNGEFTTAVFVRPANISEFPKAGKPIVEPMLTYRAKLKSHKSLQFGRMATYVIPTDSNGQNITLGENYDLAGYVRNNNLYVTHISPSSRQ